MIRSSLIALFGLGLVSACGEKDTPTTPAPQPVPPIEVTPEPAPEVVGISFVDPVVFVPLGGRDVTGAFVTIRGGKAPVKVVAASSAVATSMELHTHIMGEDGTMAMRRVESFEIPAGGERELRRGGDHLMLFGVAGEALVPGQTVVITVTVEHEDGRREDFTVPFLVVEHQ